MNPKLRLKLVRFLTVSLTSLEKLFVSVMVISVMMLVLSNWYQEDIVKAKARQFSDSRIGNLHDLLSKISNRSKNLQPIQLIFADQRDVEKGNTLNASLRNLSKYSSIIEPEVKNVKFAVPTQRQVGLLNTTGNPIKSLPGVSMKNLKQNLEVEPVVKAKASLEEEENVGNKIRYNTSISPNKELKISGTINTSHCLPIPQDIYIPKTNERDCSSPHIIIHDGGRLGNKMCQYISLYLLRHIFGIRVSITENMKTKLEVYFKNINLPVQDFKCFPKKTTRTMYNDIYMKLNSAAIKATQRNSVSNWKSLLDESYYIFHHPCPRDLITANRDLTREVLGFQDNLLRKAKRTIKKALRYINRRRTDTTLITVHVRRKDYAQYLMKHYNLSQLSEVYFHRAFDYYRARVRNPAFVVVSNDHLWCRKNLETSDVVVAGTRDDPMTDMAILSLGDHHIISYGTFSFMGAILGSGTIVHPLNDNKAYDHFNCADPAIFKAISRDENITQNET